MNRSTGFVFAFLAALLLAAPLALPQAEVHRPAPDRRAGEAAGVISSMEFVNTDITSIFKIVSDLTGWSVVMSPELVETPPRVNLWIKNMTADQVLEQVGHLAGIIIDRDEHVVRVMSFAEYARRHGLEQRVITLRHNSAAAIAAILQPFADQQGSRVLAEASTNQVVLLAPQPLVDSLERLVARLDVPMAREEMRVVRIEHIEAAQLIPVLKEFLLEGEMDQSAIFREQDREGEGAGGDQSSANARASRPGHHWLVRFMLEPKLNVIVLRGLRDDVDRTERLIRELDVAPPLQTLGYQLNYTNVGEAYVTLQSLIEDEIRRDGVGRRFRIAASGQNNRLVVEGSPRDHRRVAELLATIDQPLPAGSGGSRVYRLDNASAAEVAGVLQQLMDTRSGAGGLARRERSGEPRVVPRPDGPAAADAAAGAGDMLPASITAAPEINAVLIRASAAEHEEFAGLIRELDQPRDQVLLEVTLVSIRSDDAFRLGVEIAGARVNGVTTEVIGLSSFGIGDVDSATGELSLTSPPPFGANLGIFSSTDFSLVLNALRSVGTTHITSAPRVLVQDNSSATIEQKNEEPFESLSISDGALVRSFGGFAEAGTKLLVTPHISRDDWLRLDYDVELSAFGARTPQQLAANLPPPRRVSTSGGTVRVPADHMVVLGGLRSTNDQDQVDRVPVLGAIPLVGNLFKSQQRNRISETLYIFIRPVVLRDRGLQDLIDLSAADAAQARIVPDGPSNPMKFYLPNDESEPHE